MNLPNYAENSPIGNIDLWGLQKYFSSDGEFIKQHGEDNSLRIVPEYRTGYLEYNYPDDNDEWIDQSTPAYSSKDKRQVLSDWSKENIAKTIKNSREYGMSTYTKDIEDSDGEIIEAFILGSTEEGNLYRPGKTARVNLDNSKPNLPGWEKSGWKRSSSIHTHPFGRNDDFSDEYYGGSGLLSGDIQWALKHNVELYLVVKNNPHVLRFDPIRYNEVVKRGADGKPYSKSEHEAAVERAIRQGLYLH